MTYFILFAYTSYHRLYFIAFLTSIIGFISADFISTAAASLPAKSAAIVNPNAPASRLFSAKASAAIAVVSYREPFGI